ncbi:7854_t:CDS:2 [Gigaspora margarita]|uniref:7854_t:CDS:1 n=1 Tax=Gigaspora margarita TaxID=4874 RepID=A0ABN7WZE1_GIGMA|nr:7854_t:CDS:2 [Gigaspora margarita]
MVSKGLPQKKSFVEDAKKNLNENIFSPRKIILKEIDGIIGRKTKFRRSKIKQMRRKYICDTCIVAFYYLQRLELLSSIKNKDKRKFFAINAAHILHNKNEANILVDTFNCDKDYCCIINCCQKLSGEGCGRKLTIFQLIDPKTEKEYFYEVQKGGRPPKYVSPAERQKAYRRQLMRERAKRPEEMKKY